MEPIYYTTFKNDDKDLNPYKNILHYAKIKYSPEYNVDSKLKPFIEELNIEKFDKLCENLSKRNENVKYTSKKFDKGFRMIVKNKSTKDEIYAEFYKRGTYTVNKAIPDDTILSNVFLDFSSMKCFFNTDDDDGYSSCQNTFLFMDEHTITDVLSTIDVLMNIMDYAKFYKIRKLCTKNIMLYCHNELSTDSFKTFPFFYAANFKVVCIKGDVAISKDYSYDNYLTDLKEFKKLI